MPPKNLHTGPKRALIARYKTIDEHDDVRFVTQYTNGAYTVFVNEVGNEIYANVAREDIHYPSIFNSGINISATGTLTPIELKKHIERLNIAKETYKQIFNMFDGIRIN
ncbi:hypothetical protein ACIQZG_02385 [Lysinibacillus sp. NPDC096418]|uniref:hypothetical protein n=1 Tax=Lysinibacillus sp. NPDC096418 TaxID=3364138 RepID=UPI00380E48F8